MHAGQRFCIVVRAVISGGSKGGRNLRPPPPPNGSIMVFIPICIKMLISKCFKNKAPIARESIKTTLELPGPLSGPWTPAKRDFDSRARNVPALTIFLPPPPMAVLDPPLVIVEIDLGNCNRCFSLSV